MIPDVALLAAQTIFLGQKDLNLSSTDLMLMTSKRFGVNATMSLTPYLAARFLLVRASSKPLGYAPDSPVPAAPATVVAEAAQFPTLDRTLYRTTLGLRLATFAATVAAEATWFGGGHYKASGGYPDYRLASSLSGAVKLGFEF
jgi:hypothetical protein